jgi:hypothetical protein
MSEPINTAAAVYRSLANQGLMLRKDGTGRDDALWKELVFQLGLPEGTTELPKALESSDITVEQFVRAFFSCFEPFALMMAEICQIMQKHDAKRSYHSISIKYSFSDEDDAVDFSLSHFRDYWRSYQRLYQRAVFRFWNEWDLSRMREDLERHSLAYLSENTTADEECHWIASNSIPDGWATDKEVISLAKTLQALWNSLSNLSQESPEVNNDSSSPLVYSHSQNERFHDGLEHGDSLREFFIQQEVTSRPLNAGEIDDFLGIIHQASGYLAWIAKLRQSEESPEFCEKYQYSQANSLKNIIEHFSDLPTEERIVESLIEEIHTILNLPVWKYRWQLYQVWVGLYFLNRMQEYGLPFNVYVQNGRIELYEHHPAQLADVVGCESPISFWAELQTALPTPIGKPHSIKPDYRLSRSPVTNPKNTLLLLEAKQRLEITEKELCELIERYRIGCPNGTIVFVNYDNFPELLGKNKRTVLLSQFRPNRSDRFKMKLCADMLIQELAEPLIDEINKLAEAKKAEAKSNERKEVSDLIEKAEKTIAGIEFVKGFHATYHSERIGAIVLDYRSPKSRKLFKSAGSARDTVIQMMRANPLAQVRLAGTDLPPKLAYTFNYDADRKYYDETDCDLQKLITTIKDNVVGKILIFGYSSELSGAGYISGIILHPYTD